MPEASPTTTMSPQNAESCTTFTQQLAEAEELTNELKRLLVRYESALEQEGIRQQVETLERWMESYRHGLSAARKISENGTSLLTEMRERLKFAADELQRLENEGGNPASKEQTTQVEEFLKITRRIDQVIPNIEHIFSETGPADEAQTLEKEHA
jgi:hypothetical protein